MSNQKEVRPRLKWECEELPPLPAGFLPVLGLTLKNSPFFFLSNQMEAKILWTNSPRRPQGTIMWAWQWPLSQGDSFKTLGPTMREGGWGWWRVCAHHPRAILPFPLSPLPPHPHAGLPEGSQVMIGVGGKTKRGLEYLPKPSSGKS